MINESESVTINIKGKGVMPRVELSNRLELIEVGNVEVGSTKRVMVDILNRCSKDIWSSIVENVIVTTNKLANTEESWIMSERGMSITPRAFTIGSRRAIRLTILFSPVAEFNTFIVPLVLSIAGAKFTLTKFQMRSSWPKIARGLRRVLTARSIDVDEGDDQIADALKKRGEPDLARLAGEMLDRRQQPPFLRKLGEEECICHGEHIEQLLRSVGWHMEVESDLAVFFHKPTGLFLEIPEYSEHQLSKNVEPADTLKFDFRNGNSDSYYELWHLDNLLAKGFIKPGNCVSIQVSSDKLKSETLYNANGKLEECKVDSTSLLMLEFQVFTLGSAERNPAGQIPEKCLRPEKSVEIRNRYGSLLSTSYVRVYKGFRVVRPAAGKEYIFYDRLVVGGIEKIVSFSEDGMACMIESFGDAYNRQGKVIQSGISQFASIQLQIESPNVDDIISQFSINSTIAELLCESSPDALIQEPLIPHVFQFIQNRSILNIQHKSGVSSSAVNKNFIGTLPEKIRSRSIINHIGASPVPQSKHNMSIDDVNYEILTTSGHQVHPVNSTTDIETIKLPRPNIVKHQKHGIDLIRSLEITCERRHLVRGQVQHDVIGKTLIFNTHTARGLANRAAAGISQRSLYPCEVFCENYVLHVGVLEPLVEDAGQEFDVKGNPVNASPILNTSRLLTTFDKIRIGRLAPKSAASNMHNNLYLGQWVFVHENHDLHLVSSAAPPIGRFHHDYEGGKEEFSKNAIAKAQMQVSSAPCTDIHFKSRGFHAKLEDSTTLLCINGFAVQESIESHSTVHNKMQDSTIKKFQTFSYTGAVFEVLETSPTLVSIYEKKSRSDILHQIKSGFEKMLDIKQRQIRAQKTKDANLIIAEFQQRVELEMAQSGTTKLSNAQIKAQARVLQLAEKMKNASSLSKAPDDIYNELIDRVRIYHIEQSEKLKLALPDATQLGSTAATEKCNLESSSDYSEGRLVLKQFINFLRHVTLPGHEGPLAKNVIANAMQTIESETIPAIGSVISRDAFAKWYTLDEAKEYLDLLNPKSMFSILLDEHLASQNILEDKATEQKKPKESTGVKGSGDDAKEGRSRGKKKGIMKRLSSAWNVLSKQKNSKNDEELKTSDIDVDVFDSNQETGVRRTRVGSAIRRFSGLFMRKNKPNTKPNPEIDAKESALESKALPMQILHTERDGRLKPNGVSYITPDGSEAGTDSSTEEDAPKIETVGGESPNDSSDSGIDSSVDSDEDS